MKIRKAKLEDCQKCLELSKISELLNPDKSPSHLWWIKGFVKENQIFFVAEENKEVIGFIMGERTTGDIAILHLLVVEQEYRNKGIGSKLMEVAEDECRKRKLKAILLYGYANNTETIKFIENKKYIRGALTYEFVKFL